MGTRNSTLVYLEGKTKVAQYGQWDGYPTGQGKTIAEFLKTVDLPKFKEQIKALKPYTDKETIKIWKEAGATDDSEFVSMEVSEKVKKDHPELSRDTAAEVLKFIHNGTVTKVQLNEDFKNDSTFCEYYYEIDLDKDTISVNGGKKYSFKQWTQKDFMKKLEKAESKD